MDAIASRGFTLNGRALAQGDPLELAPEQFRDLRDAGLVEAAPPPPAAPKRRGGPAKAE